MPSYDPNEARKLADGLLGSAKWIMIFYPLQGAVFGAALAVVTGRTNFVLIALYGLSGALFGSTFAFQRARVLRAQAQSLLCQMKIEENTRR